MRFLKLLFVLFNLLFIGVHSSYAQTNTAKSSVPPTAIATSNVAIAKTIKVKVKGVGCSRDLQAISANVAKVDGVSICETLKKGATTTFSVTYNPSVATEKTIYSAVEDTPGCSNQTDRPYKVKM